MFVSFASEYTALGFACLGFNQPGMGSPGVPGWCESWESYVDNAAFASKELARKANVEWSVQGAPSAPLFVHGQSMGGALAIDLAQRLPNAVTGVMLSAPMCGIAPDRVPNACGIGMLKCLEACCPAAALVPQEDIMADCFKCATQLEQRRKYNKQSAMPNQPLLRTGLQLYNATLHIQDSAAAFAPPAVLLVQGGQDAVTDKGMTKQYIKQCGGKNRVYIEYTHSWHVLEADGMDTRAAMLHDVLQWTAAWTSAWEAANPTLVTQGKQQGADAEGAGDSKDAATDEADDAAADEAAVQVRKDPVADSQQEETHTGTPTLWSRPTPLPGFMVVQPTKAAADPSVQAEVVDGVHFVTRDTGLGPLPKHDEEGKPIPGSNQLEESP
mgnify:CR=1 FL=1